jgi:aminopeptidase N
LQAYFAEMRYETATAYDMLRIFEEVSGQDLDAVFYEWVGDFEGLDPAAKAQVDNDNAN